MKRTKTLDLVIDFLELNYEGFQKYLEDVKEIEGTEAELIIANLEKMIGEKK